MLRAAKNVAAFTANMTEQEFLSNEMAKYAVTMGLQIIGETASRVLEKCPDFVTDHPELPFHQMRGMRNRISHGYFTVVHETVWETARNDVPGLIASLERLVRT